MHFTNEEFVKAIFVTSIRLEALAQKVLFKPLGISASVAGVLGLLRVRGGLSPTEIKSILGSTKSNITQRLNLLTKRGLIEKIGASGDGRSIEVRLTKAGEDLADELHRHVQMGELHFSQFFTPTEISTHIAFFRKLNELLDKCQTEPCPYKLNVK